MKATLTCSALLAFAIATLGDVASKPRVFITESASPHASGDATVGGTKGSLAFTGGTSPQNIEVMNAFSQRCPAVIITADRDRAEYVVSLDHEAINRRRRSYVETKVAVFDKNEDLMFSNSTPTLGSAVKRACIAISAGLAWGVHGTSNPRVPTNQSQLRTA